MIPGVGVPRHSHGGLTPSVPHQTSIPHPISKRKLGQASKRRHDGHGNRHDDGITGDKQARGTTDGPATFPSSHAHITSTAPPRRQAHNETHDETHEERQDDNAGRRTTRRDDTRQRTTSKHEAMRRRRDETDDARSRRRTTRRQRRTQDDAGRQDGKQARDDKTRRPTRRPTTRIKSIKQAGREGREYENEKDKTAHFLTYRPTPSPPTLPRPPASNNPPPPGVGGADE